MKNLQDKTLTVSGKYIKNSFCHTDSGEETDNTVFCVSYDEKFLYFTFICKEKFFSPKHSEYNAPLYDGDIVELMISLGEKNKYFEVEVNQNNANYCALINNRDGRKDYEVNLLKKNIIKSVVNTTTSKWTCDIIINMEDLYDLGWRVSDFYFNAHRQSYDENNNLSLFSLSPTYCDSFHITEAFLKVNFVE